jgi:Mg-chelatase subunit ChlI
VDPNFKGAVFQSKKSPVVRSVLEFVDALSLEFKAIDCASGCDPGDPESFCYECRLRYLDAAEPPEFKTVLRTFPIIQLDKEHTTKDMMGDIYIRFLATTSDLSEVNRGVLFIENIDQLDKDIIDMLAQTLRDREYTLEKDGKSMTFPCKFSLIGTLSKKDARIDASLEKQITLLVSGEEEEDDLEYRTKYIQYKKDYDADPAAFQTRIERARREWILDYLRARKIMPTVTLPEALDKALDRYSTVISSDECFPPKLKGLAKVIAARNLKTEVSDADAAEAIEIIRKQEREQAEGDIDIPPVFQPFVGVAEAVAEAEVLKDKLLLLLVSMEEISGALIRGFNPDAVRSALRYLQEMEFTIKVVEGCRQSCDPSRPEEFCPECRIKFENDEINIMEEKLPVVFLPKDVDVPALKGSVFVNYVVRPNLLTRAHRGILFVENIDELEYEMETALASALTTGRNTVEAEGKVVEQPCRILLITTIGDLAADIHPLLSGRLSVLLEATPEDRTLIRLRALEYLEEFGTQPELFSSGIMASKEESRKNVLTGQELLPEIQISDTQLDLIARMCAEFDVEGNSNEFRIESVAKSLAAMNAEKRVEDEHIVNAAQMVIPLSASSKKETREELAESIRQMVLQYA